MQKATRWHEDQSVAWWCFLVRATAKQRKHAVLIVFLSAFLVGLAACGSSSKAVVPPPVVTNPPPPASVAAPVFTPAAGTIASGQGVTISDSTNVAQILYSLDGSEPTQPYTAPIPLTSSATIKSVAVLGSASSAVAQADYTIESQTNPPPPPSNPPPSNPPTSNAPNLVQLSINPTISVSAGNYIVVVDIEFSQQTPTITDDAGILVAQSPSRCSNSGSIFAFYCPFVFIEPNATAGVHTFHGTQTPSASGGTFVMEYHGVTHGLDTTVIDASVGESAIGVANSPVLIGAAAPGFPSENILAFAMEPGESGLLAGVQPIEGNPQIVPEYADSFFTIETFSTGTNVTDLAIPFYTTNAGPVSGFAIGIR